MNGPGRRGRYAAGWWDGRCVLLSPSCVSRSRACSGRALRLGVARSGGDEAKWSSTRLAAQSELLDEHAVALHVLLAEVAELPTSPADELEQPATRVVVVRVLTEMVRESPDALGQERDLDLGGAGVSLVGLVFVDDLLPTFRGDERGDASWSCSCCLLPPTHSAPGSSLDRAVVAAPWFGGPARARAVRPRDHASTGCDGGQPWMSRRSQPTPSSGGACGQASGRARCAARRRGGPARRVGRVSRRAPGSRGAAATRPRRARPCRR